MTEKANFMTKMQKRVFGTTDHIKSDTNAIKATESAPEMGFDKKFKEIDNPSEMIESRKKMFNIKTIFSLMKEMKKTRKTIKKNPPKREDIAQSNFFIKLRDYADTLDVKIGYAKLPRELIFKNHAVLYDNAIVLSMEMDKEKIDMSPSLETGKMVINTYDELGIRTNKLANFIQKNGFAAQACHPLGGPISYTPLGMLAGLGWPGRHGLLITPDYGPRHRLSAILTNITNLPIPETNAHKWIKDYCVTCGRCITKCPSKAIFEIPIEHEDGRITHIDVDKCFPIFGRDYGCSVCVKECMFNRVGYTKLKEQINKKKSNL
ncbi:MAG TPA: reductive dehalogenase domain-containing protein [Candidatus Bathyarchaeia archaeon]|nr:reductive dehalogenase domain-containing protein [Candidatus Bathyarchaeia archaeon]